MRVAISGGLLLAFLLVGGVLAGRAVQAGESTAQASPASASTSLERSRRNASADLPPPGLILPAGSLPRSTAPANR